LYDWNQPRRGRCNRQQRHHPKAKRKISRRFLIAQILPHPLVTIKGATPPGNRFVELAAASSFTTCRAAEWIDHRLLYNNVGLSFIGLFDKHSFVIYKTPFCKELGRKHPQVCQLLQLGGDMVRREKANYVIQSVSHALDVLEQFYGSSDEIGVTELSKRLKLHKNNVFRLLATLEARGYIEQNKITENYRLGLKCLQLGQTFIKQMGLLLQSRTILEELARHTKESVFVAVRKGKAIIPLDFVEPSREVRVVSFLGTALPAHCTAAGKVHLVFEPEGGLSQNLSERLERYTDKTIVDRKALMEQMKEISETGYAVEWGEFSEDVSSVAVPIRDYTRTLVGSLAVVGPGYRLNSESTMNHITPAVVQAGKELSKRLGYPG
jgi:IclR family transcriptional regulator, KDG regulon repressor